MKSARLALACLALAALHAGPANALKVGDRAPEIAAQNANTTPVRLSAYKGQVVLLDFWASWCGPCKQSFPWMNALHAKYAAQGLRIVAVNVDQKREDGERFLAQRPAQFQVAWDPEGSTPAAYAVKAMPSSVLISAEGRVLHLHAGFRDEDAAALEARIVAALADRR